MRINSVNNFASNQNNKAFKEPSFNGVYTLKGKSDILDEICWYMSKVQKRPEEKFDFIDIRCPHSLKTQKNGIFLLSDTICVGEKVIVNPIAHNPSRDDNSFVDLFVTGEDKKLVHSVMRDMVEDSVGKIKRSMTMLEKIRILLSNLNEMDEKVCHRKPVSNVDFAVLKGYMGKIFDISKIKEINAEDAYEGLQKGSFDILEGTFKQK